MIANPGGHVLAQGRADVEEVDRQPGADERDVDVEAVLSQRHQPATRLALVPVMGAGEPSLDLEIASEVPAEVSGRLNVAVRPVNLLMPVVKVHVRDDELAVFLENFLD